MVKDYKDSAAQVMTLFGHPKNTANVFAQKLPEIKDCPSVLNLSLLGVGSLIGDEDCIS